MLHAQVQDLVENRKWGIEEKSNKSKKSGKSKVPTKIKTMRKVVSKKVKSSKAH